MVLFIGLKYVGDFKKKHFFSLWLLWMVISMFPKAQCYFQFASSHNLQNLRLKGVFASKG